MLAIKDSRLAFKFSKKIKAGGVAGVVGFHYKLISNNLKFYLRTPRGPSLKVSRVGQP